MQVCVCVCGCFKLTTNSRTHLHNDVIFILTSIFHCVYCYYDVLVYDDVHVYRCAKKTNSHNQVAISLEEPTPCNYLLTVS